MRCITLLTVRHDAVIAIVAGVCDTPLRHDINDLIGDNRRCAALKYIDPPQMMRRIADS